MSLTLAVTRKVYLVTFCCIMWDDGFADSHSYGNKYTMYLVVLFLNCL